MKLTMCDGAVIALIQWSPFSLSHLNAGLMIIDQPGGKNWIPENQWGACLSDKKK